MANPETKLVTQLMVLVSRASLGGGGEESLLVQVTCLSRRCSGTTGPPMGFAAQTPPVALPAHGPMGPGPSPHGVRACRCRDRSTASG